MPRRHLHTERNRYYLKEKEIQKVKKVMKEANTRISELIETRHRDVAELEKDMIVALGVIKDFREQINNTVDELEKTTKREFESKYAEIRAAIKADIAAMNIVVKDLEACQQQLESAEGNRSQQFVCMKKGQQKQTEADKMGKDITKYERTITMEIDKSIEQFLNGLHSLGRTIEQSSPNPFKVQQHCSLYQGTGRKDHKINESKSNSYGSCILTNGDVLLTIYDNKTLKRFDCSTCNVVDECQLPACPIGVCEIGPHETGVALNNRTIQIVSLGNKMVPTRSINMNHYCYDLCFSDGEIFVSDQGNAVYVHDLSGRLLRTICKDQSGANIFNQIRHVTVSDDGNNIYVADIHKCVIILDKKGEVLSHFSDLELSGASGVCTDGCDNVFVSAFSSRNVLQVGLSGDKIGSIVNKSDLAYNPLSVCYDRSNSRLIVTGQRTKDITVFELV